MTGQRRHREKQSAAIGAETLRLNDGPGPRRGADIDVGDFLVFLRDLGQQRCVIPERGLDIPARQIAVDRRFRAVSPKAIQQQQHTNR